MHLKRIRRVGVLDFREISAKGYCFGSKITLGIQNQLVEPTTKFDAINRNS